MTGVSTAMEERSFDPVFAVRLARHEDELRWLYCELYHGDMQAYDYFVHMLHRAYQARPERLRQRDLARLENPDWYKGLTVKKELHTAPCLF